MSLQIRFVNDGQYVYREYVDINEEDGTERVIKKIMEEKIEQPETLPGIKIEFTDSDGNKAVNIKSGDTVNLKLTAEKNVTCNIILPIKASLNPANSMPVAISFNDENEKIKTITFTNADIYSINPAEIIVDNGEKFNFGEKLIALVVE